MNIDQSESSDYDHHRLNHHPRDEWSWMSDVVVDDWEFDKMDAVLSEMRSEREAVEHLRRLECVSGMIVGIEQDAGGEYELSPLLLPPQPHPLRLDDTARVVHSCEMDVAEECAHHPSIDEEERTPFLDSQDLFGPEPVQTLDDRECDDSYYYDDLEQMSEDSVSDASTRFYGEQQEYAIDGDMLMINLHLHSKNASRQIEETSAAASSLTMMEEVEATNPLDTPLMSADHYCKRKPLPMEIMADDGTTPSFSHRHFSRPLPPPSPRLSSSISFFPLVQSNNSHSAPPKESNTRRHSMLSSRDNSIALFRSVMGDNVMLAVTSPFNRDREHAATYSTPACVASLKFAHALKSRLGLEASSQIIETFEFVAKPSPASSQPHSGRRNDSGGGDSKSTTKKVLQAVDADWAKYGKTSAAFSRAESVIIRFSIDLDVFPSRTKFIEVLGGSVIDCDDTPLSM
jgi:hypothetical protein